MNQTETNLRRLVDVGVVAGYLDVAPDTIYTMVSQRQIPFIKVGRLLKFDLKAIDAWIARNSVMPMPEKRG
jgi:excisionase family DNA binding protein